MCMNELQKETPGEKQTSGKRGEVEFGVERVAQGIRILRGMRGEV